MVAEHTFSLNALRMATIIMGYKKKPLEAASRDKFSKYKFPCIWKKWVVKGFLKVIHGSSYPWIKASMVFLVHSASVRSTVFLLTVHVAGTL